MTIQTFADAVATLKLIYKGNSNYLFSYLDWWQQELGPDMPLASVTIERIDEGIAKLMSAPALQFKRGIGTIEGKKKRSAATINRYVGVLCTMYKLLKQSRYLPRNFVSPIVRGTKLPEGPGKTLQVCLEDVHKLIAGARLTRNLKLPALVAVGCTSGLRKGNLQSMTWDQIDLTKGLIDVPTTKNGAPVRSVLPRWALQELLRIKPAVLNGRALVFGAGNFKKSFASALKHAGLPEDWTIHSMRHIAASVLAQSGASVPTIMSVLNHKTPSMSLRYSHLNTAAIEAAVSKAWA